MTNANGALFFPNMKSEKLAYFTKWQEDVFAMRNTIFVATLCSVLVYRQQTSATFP